MTGNVVWVVDRRCEADENATAKDRHFFGARKLAKLEVIVVRSIETDAQDLVRSPRAGDFRRPDPLRTLIPGPILAPRPIPFSNDTIGRHARHRPDTFRLYFNYPQENTPKCFLSRQDFLAMSCHKFIEDSRARIVQHRGKGE